MPCAVVIAFALLSTELLCELIQNFVFISGFLLRLWRLVAIHHIE